MVEKSINKVLEREFLYLLRFHRRFAHFDICVQQKLQNVPRIEINFMLNFAMCSVDFTCVNGSTIQIVPDSDTRIVIDH